MKQTGDHYVVVVTGDTLASEALKLLSKKCEADFAGAYPKPSDLAKRLYQKEADALIVRTGKILREVIQASPKLKVIAKHGIGVDNIDIDAATELKIPVLISASANYRSVAEHTLALMLCLAKDIPSLDTRLRQGFWDKSAYRGIELYGKKLGLIGFGRIGRRLSELVAPFQMKVLIFDPLITGDVPAGVTRVEDMQTLLKTVDIVSLHCPLTDQTRHLIGRRELGMMKKTAWLINAARGEVVDEEALIDALREGAIAGAGLDTFAKEPPEDLNRLCNAGKIVLTPHVAASTEEAFTRMGVEAAQNVLTILEKKRPERTSLINPEIYGEGK